MTHAQSKLRKNLDALRQAGRDKNLAVLLGLGFASGLPFALVSSTLSAWMTDARVPLPTIGAFALVALPYSLKFLWAPLLDRYQIPGLGRRRGWIILTQLGLILALGGLAFVGPSQLGLFAFLAALCGFLAASQDIVSDGYRADLLSSKELAAGTSLFLLGYRVALFISTVGALLLADFLDGPGQKPIEKDQVLVASAWLVVYGVMAALMGIGILTALFAPEPALQGRPPASLSEAMERPFFSLLRYPRAALLLVFVFFYRLADSLIAITNPFYLQLGFSKAEIATIGKFLGAGSSIAGVFLGGLLLAKAGLRRSLWIGGIVTAVANLGFTGLALTGKNYPMLMVAIGFDNLFSALVGTVFSGFLASLCDKRFSATQFALLTSITSMAGRLLGASSGYLAETLGWASFFAFSLVGAIPGLVALGFLPASLFAPRDETTSEPSADSEASARCPSCGDPDEGAPLCASCGASIHLRDSARLGYETAIQRARSWILFLGLGYAAFGLWVVLGQDAGLTLSKLLPLLVLYLWLTTIHLGLWAWSKLNPLGAAKAGAILFAVSLGLDLIFYPQVLDIFFAPDWFFHPGYAVLYWSWLSLRALHGLWLLPVWRSAKKAQKALSA
jgi:PAT family beta-lactamase induction signal transducer AmpG